ncbi:hypothetical protein I6N98_09130 [Spongiibacter nanhainus]|uniref:Uncharacterized protein n=1 Tax=Spongiibacter nanhainus TaxID=2794344 RepID=A0A7T4US51_9GAMM|nr:hypothetical protein [Spongiibacter nanhainus]QQD19973.1 hypothetical protein I6N98_09130 [Spongiibacter nanhainus]
MAIQIWVVTAYFLCKKGFYFEVFLDAFEEQFDLPAGLIHIGNGLGGKMEMIG